ncbi:MAG: aspartate kinase, partial [Flavobacteriales bacterium]
MKNQNQVQIYKFGGASVKEASSLRQVGQIVSQSDSPQLLIVVSAMGKTTNKLESIINHCFRTGEVKLDEVQSLKKEHEDIVKALDLALSLDTFFDEFKHCCLSTPKTHFSYYYDQCIGFGELISSTILASYLDKTLGNTAFLDVRNLILTNDKHQNAEVDWEKTRAAVLSQDWNKSILVTQGFIAQ